MPPDGSFILMRGLKRHYRLGDTVVKALDGIDLDVQRGEFLVLMGPSGSGKSTLLNIISGIDRPDGGAVWLDGQNLVALDERQRTLFRRRSIGFVFQFFNLIPTLTVWENVILPAELGGAVGAGERERAAELLDAVGLLERRDTFPDRLSGGEQQRVAIARALVNDPLLVLADEPTGNLDEATGARVLELLDRLTRQAGKNMIMVTHSAEAAGYADRVLCLQGGTLGACERSLPGRSQPVA